MSSGIKRRTFLQSASMAAGFTAAPAGAASHEEGAAGEPIRLGLIGLGRRGRNLMRAMEDNADLRVVAICDVYKPHLEQGAKMAPDARQHSDFRDVIAADDIDAIVIATPDHWHPYMTVEAVKAGKDVYVEKPISVTIEEGRTMVKAARKYNRIVQVGTQQRSGPHFQKAVEIVRSGKIGDIGFVRTWNWGNEHPAGIGSPDDSEPPADLDWDMWLGPAPVRPFNANRFGVDPHHYSFFRYFWDYAGGMMTDWGIHLLDIVLWAMEVNGPNVITASGAKTTLADNRDTPDTLLVNYEFPDFLCVYENRTTNANTQWPESYGIAFHGTEGTLFVDRSRWQIYPEMKDVDPTTWTDGIGRMVPEFGGRVGNSTANHWKDFVKAVRTRKEPICDIETGHRSTATAILGNIALRSKQRVQWDPETETTTSEEAQLYLSREARDPWKLVL